MPVIMLAVIAFALVTASTASIAGGVIGSVVMLGLFKWYEIEEEHSKNGTPWQYRPTLWVMLFLTFVGLLVYGKLST